jgi:hypothetical protein
MSPEPTPFELVTALRSADGSARATLEAWCGDSITRLIASVAPRLGLTVGDAASLRRRALRWVEMYLRTRDPASYEGYARKTFVISVVVAAFRWLDPLVATHDEAFSISRRTPEFDSYEVRSYSRPLERVGGDWWDHDVAPGRVLWIIVADVTGHGYPAYLLAAGLPHLWRAKVITELRATMRQPRELLSALGRELETVLPDDLFVEAVLGRFGSTGEAVLAAAGGFHPILRHSRAGDLEFPSLSGCFLGLELGERDECSWSLEDGDELLLATDGLFDQPSSAQDRLGNRLAEHCRNELARTADLHGAVLGVLGRVLGEHAQHDDITVITVLRQDLPLRASGLSDAGM